MKKHEMKAALEALKKIKMPAIEDKGLRNSIITDHLTLVRAQKRYEKDVRDLDTVHLAAYAEEREKVTDLQRQLQIEKDPAKAREIAAEIETHKDLFAAVRDFNKSVQELGEEEVEIHGVPEADFLEELQKQDFDLGQIEALESMLIHQ